ncbi:SDR family oxidoreductase [Lewinella sp. W8]|uniref:SDR family oxidoreductase n=1 Tax=Lewinella sp. W8 TaxID=2528208 RepID=UPI0010685210|nr:SDR family oxidoreductase [Lewinella sp. W8]MTB53957.1 SDR family NAD(P)-dependent oxidoreductase [Lewinella sp. W8]
MTSVLITGVSSGIGLTTARSLLDRGYYVYGTVRRAEDAAELAGHASFTALVMDVTDRPSIVGALDTIARGAHPLTAVINNAGVAVSGPLETLAEEDYRRQFEVNVFGLLAVCQEALPQLHAAREAGLPNVKIINISSVSGYLTSPFTGIYSASKFAIEAITDGLRRELFDFGIDVISVAPGPVKTPIWTKAKTQTKAYEGTRYEYVLEKIDAYADNAAADGVVPQVVADDILTALTTDKPRPDRLVMKKGWLARLVTLLPKRTQDKMFLKRIKENRRY